MKNADWTKSFPAKAGAFLLATLLVPFGVVCGGALAAAYEFEWWTGGNADYQAFLDWAQGKYWTFRAMGALHALYRAAIPLLAAAVLLFLFLVIFLARTAARQPGCGEPRPGWQEKIPFDLYLLAAGTAAALLVGLLVEAEQQLGDEPLLLVLLLLAVSAAIAALCLGAWMTLCARAKLGGWWRNTVTFRALGLCLRALKWVWRALCAVGRSLLGFARSVPLVWKTVLAAGAFCSLAFVLAAARAFELLLLLLLLGFAAVCAVSLQLRRLQAGGEALAAGDSGARVDTKHMFWDLRRHGENLNDISRGIRRAVDEQLRSERLKTELITNVSHDIKTPLTSIINYVDLLGRDPDGVHAKEYVEILARQSKRLKKLTEDLVEMSKASTGNLPVNASRRSVSELLLQALGEYGDRLERAQLEAVLTLPERELFVRADGTLLWRVLDNLFSNACKYALPGTRFYIDAQAVDGKVHLSFKNISRDRLNVPAGELMERFVRGDSARGGEGSGLGLNIARSLTELQGGTLDLTVDGDLFRADLTLPAAD